MKKLILLSFTLLTTTLLLSSCTLKSKKPDQLAQENIKNKALDFCNDTEQKTVFLCDDFIKVTTPLVGNGPTYYKPDGSELSCPLVSPASISQECKDLALSENCQQLCQSAIKVDERPIDPAQETIREVMTKTNISFSHIQTGQFMWNTKEAPLSFFPSQVTSQKVTNQEKQDVENIILDMGFQKSPNNPPLDLSVNFQGYEKTDPETQTQIICKVFSETSLPDSNPEDDVPAPVNKEGMKIACATL